MKKQRLPKLALAKETLVELEDRRLLRAAGGTRESICYCLTDLCITADFSNCASCNCS